jgi:hypothetical protein
MSDIRELLPALSIRPRTDQPAITLRDLEVCLDGVPLKGLQRATISMAHDNITRLALRMNVSDVEIDPVALAVLTLAAHREDEEAES